MHKHHKRRRSLPNASQKCQQTKYDYINPHPYEGQLHKTLKPDFQITRNPYLNYFRQFYAKKKGRVVEAAVQAGANWRKMTRDQKDPYIKAAKGAPYVVATRVKRLIRSATTKQGIFAVQKLLQRWTRQVYKVVIKSASKIS